MSEEEILIETTRLGVAIEVRAISASDGLEVTFAAPAAASPADIQRLALAKLTYVRSRGAAGEPKSSDGRGGVLA